MAYNFITDPSGYMDSQEFADIIAGICGDGTVVFNVGKKMEASMADVNTLRIMDGIVLSGNQIVGITAGTSVDFSIPAGTDGVTNTYYVGYALSNGSEQPVSPVVHKTMMNADKRLREGDAVQNVYLYEVHQNGYVVEGITQLFSIYNGNKKESEGTTVIASDPKAAVFGTLDLHIRNKNGVITLDAANVFNFLQKGKSVNLTGTIPEEYRPRRSISATCALVNNSNITGYARFTISSAGVVSYVSSVTGWQEAFFSVSWPAKEVE